VSARVKVSDERIREWHDRLQRGCCVNGIYSEPAAAVCHALIRRIQGEGPDEGALAAEAWDRVERALA
jgi:hypothetical protein